jgi:hypothetical protein
VARRPTRRARRPVCRCLIGALVVGLTVGPAGPSAARAATVPPFEGPPGGPKVAAVGDSILGQLQSEGPTHPTSIRAFTLSLIDEGWQASVKTRNAWRINRIRLLAGAAVDRGAEVVILSAGSGDVRWVRESDDPAAARQVVRRSIRLVLRDLQDLCVVWPTMRVAGGTGERRTVRAVNDELDTADAASTAVRSPDWAALARRHPGWFIADGVHLSRSGEAAFQRTLLAATGRCVAGLG